MRLVICILMLANFLANTNQLAAMPGLEGFSQPIQTDSIAPKAFLIGEYEQAFEQLLNEHQTLLLTACNDDMNVAFEKWRDMVVAMESHSDVVNFDLKGVKLWLNIFWKEDGSIRHIAFYPKPNSRNVDTDKLTLFLMSFINNYQFPLKVGKKFSHYGVASFPTFSKKEEEEKSSDKIGPLVKDSVKSGQNE